MHVLVCDCNAACERVHIRTLATTTVVAINPDKHPALHGQGLTFDDDKLLLYDLLPSTTAHCTLEKDSSTILDTLHES